MIFNSRIFILPGLGNSGDQHWQSLWEKQFGFTRINQEEWDTPVCSDWIKVIDSHVQSGLPEETILIGHSLACSAIAFWSAKYNRLIKGALLVAPSDTEAETYPPGTRGFSPMPLVRLPFPSITVASTDDYYVVPERARFFAEQWGSELISIEAAGHINVAAGFGGWSFGLEILKRLDQ